MFFDRSQKEVNTVSRWDVWRFANGTLGQMYNQCTCQTLSAYTHSSCNVLMNK